jgi:hypothetical protein
MRSEQPLNPTHLAFASQRERIDAFHAAALQAGATDNGGPGLRAHYHPHYYSAFVYDPEGNNIEVVCHEDPAAPKPALVRASAKRAARKPAKRAARKAASKPASRPAKAKPAKAKPAKAKPAKAPKAKAKGKKKRR